MKLAINQKWSVLSYILASSITMIDAQANNRPGQALQQFIVNAQPAINGKSQVEIPLTSTQSYTWPDSPRSGNACLRVSAQSNPGSLDMIKGRAEFKSKQKIESATFVAGPSDAAYSLCALITEGNKNSVPVGVDQGGEMSDDSVIGIECAAFMLDVRFFNGLAGWKSV